MTRATTTLTRAEDRMTYTYPSTFIWAVVVAALVLLAYWRYALGHPRPSLQHRVVNADRNLTHFAWLSPIEN